MGKMVLDAGGQFIPAGIVDIHKLSFLLASLVAHDRATEGNHTHHTGKERPPITKPILYTRTIHGYST